MKPRNREIQIFNLSMLDVISGAMGAFLIVMVVLLPAYKNKDAALNDEDAERLQQENQDLRETIDELQQKLAQASRPQQPAAPPPQRKTEDPFLSFIGFPTGDGNAYLKCSANTNPNSAVTSADFNYRAGQPLLLMSQNSMLVVRPRPAEYEFICNLLSGPPQVTVLVRTNWQRGGSAEKRVPFTLGQGKVVSVVRVDANGNVRVVN